MASPPREWWPVAEADPVPGDPDTLAALGKHMRNAAAEIERIAARLPTLAASDIWDSDAGEQFRAKSKSVATDLSKAQGRFQAVATALGSSSDGGSGYAAELQHYQDQAYAAAGTVVGTDGSRGSEATRLSTWNQLLDATHGQSPSVPPPPGGAKPGQASPGVAAPPYPQAAPGSIPPDLPVFGGDSAEVASLKATYNDQLAVLRSASTTVSNAAGSIAAAAQRAAAMIRDVVDHDGLNNPHWWQAAWHDVAGYVSAHWVGFVKMVSKVAGIISAVCGIIAMVLAFIPGLQPLAAVFEAVSVLALLVGTVADVVLAATGNGSWKNAIFDGIGLVTFGIGGGLIGKVGESAETLERGANAFEEAEDLAADSGELSSLAQPADAAMDALKAAKRTSLISKVWDGFKASVDYKGIVSQAVESFQSPDEAKLAELRNLGFAGALAKGLKGAATFDSPEILANLQKMSKDAAVMTTTRDVSEVIIGPDGRVAAYAKAVVSEMLPKARDIVEAAGLDRNMFRVTQFAGISSAIGEVFSG